MGPWAGIFYKAQDMEGKVKHQDTEKNLHFLNSAKDLLSKQFSNSPLMIMEATLSKISCFLPPNPPAGLLACLLNPYWRAIWTCWLASLRPASPFCLHCMCTSNSYLPWFLSYRKLRAVLAVHSNASCLGTIFNAVRESYWYWATLTLWQIDARCFLRNIGTLCHRSCDIVPKELKSRVSSQSKLEPHPP